MPPPQDRRIEPRKGRKSGYEVTDLIAPDEFREVEEEIEGLPSNQWALQWGDLMMTMFVFFAMLYAYNLSERRPEEAFRVNESSKTALGPAVVNVPTSQSIPPGTTGKPPIGSGPTDPKSAGLTPEQLLELSENAIKETNISDVDVVLQDDNTVKISLRGPLLFDLGSAELREETVAFLEKVAQMLARTNNEVHVVGHTDNFPIHSDRFPTNWELSAVRAARVARHLIVQGPLEPGRFTVMGHSLYRPVEPNISPESKQKNRRVEIIITRKQYEPAPGLAGLEGL